MFDAEHFFDGYKRNPEYAMSAVKAAYESGARWSTVGVSANVIDASYNALYDAIVYKLFRAGVKA
jgi:hypothetical protein